MPRVATAAAKRQSQSRRRGGGGGWGEGQAVLLVGQRSPLLLLLVVDQFGEDVDAPLLAAFGAEVSQHDGAEEEAVEGHDDEDVKEGIAVGGSAAVWCGGDGGGEGEMVVCRCRVLHLLGATYYRQCTGH